MRNLLDFFKAWGAQAFIACDQATNAILMPLLTWSVGYADETLSARCWRAFDARKPWGRTLMPMIDWLFSWQKPVPDITNADGEMVRRHCERAFYKERLRRGLPPEYRDNLDAAKGPRP